MRHLLKMGVLLLSAVCAGTLQGADGVSYSPIRIAQAAEAGGEELPPPPEFSPASTGADSESAERIDELLADSTVTTESTPEPISNRPFRTWRGKRDRLRLLPTGLSGPTPRGIPPAA